MIGYIYAVFAGLSLGLIGGGGSILIVPILVYSFNFDSKISVALSLATVGTASLVGVYRHTKLKNIDFKIAILFIIFAIPGTFFGTYLSKLISGTTQLTFFSIVMAFAAVFMLRKKKDLEVKLVEIKLPFVILSSFFVGTMTGLIGVGGGFLIVPALMLFTGLKIKRAIGTSILIICVNSLIGFTSYINHIEIPWIFLSKITTAMIVGVLIGLKLSDRVPQATLKKVFAIFLILMAAFIISKNFL